MFLDLGHAGRTWLGCFESRGSWEALVGEKRTDGGLVIVGLVLLGVGLYAIFGGQLAFTPIAPREGSGFGGPLATIIGIAFVIGGLYFLRESRR